MDCRTILVLVLARWACLWGIHALGCSVAGGKSTAWAEMPWTV